MKVQDIMALFAEIEQRFSVDTWLINDIHVWPLIRLDLMMSLNLSESPKQQVRIHMFFKIHQALVMLFGYVKYRVAKMRDSGKNVHPGKVDVVFLGDGISRILLNGQWYDRFCDPLIQALQKKKRTCFMMETLHNYFIPRFSPSMFIQPYLDFALVKKMLFRKNNLKMVELKDFDRCIQFLKSKNLPIPIPDEERVRIIMEVIEAYTDYYKKILKTLKPLLGFVVCYYGPRGLAFNVACRQLNIPSVDIQHGVAGEFNAAYGKWNKVPKNGYETLPSIFWCWSKEDAHVIEQWNMNVEKWHKSIIGGNSFVHFWKNNSINFENCGSLFKKDEKSINILVTLSSIEDHNATLLKSIIEIIKRSDAHWKWWIRLHPCLLNKKKDIKTMFQDKNIANIEIDTATDLPLYMLLNHMNLHVTYSSATVIEAKMFHCPSIITGEDGLQYFADQIEAGWAIYANTPESIIKAIQIQLNKNKESIYENDKIEIFDIIDKILV